MLASREVRSFDGVRCSRHAGGPSRRTSSRGRRRETAWPSRCAFPAQVGTVTIDGAPDRDHAEHVTVDDIVDVKSSGAEKQPPSSLVSRGLVQPADVRALREEFDSRCKFFFEKVGRLVPVCAPPEVDMKNCEINTGRDQDLQGHFLRALSSATSSRASRPCPACASARPVASEASKARRLSSLRSSPSSSTTRSRTVPLGKEVGSSITIRPSRTTARSTIRRPYDAGVQRGNLSLQRRMSGVPAQKTRQMVRILRQ